MNQKIGKCRKRRSKIERGWCGKMRSNIRVRLEWVWSKVGVGKCRVNIWVRSEFEGKIQFMTLIKRASHSKPPCQHKNIHNNGVFFQRFLISTPLVVFSISGSNMKHVIKPVLSESKNKKVVRNTICSQYPDQWECSTAIAAMIAVCSHTLLKSRAINIGSWPAMVILIFTVRTITFRSPL